MRKPDCILRFMRLSIDLTEAWHGLIAKGALKNTFQDAAGRRIEAGVRLGAQGPESYAIAVDTGRAVCGPAEVTRLESGMELLYNPVGKLKPHTPPSASGSQPDIPAEAASCPLACQDPENPLSILRRPSLATMPCPNRHWRAYPNVAPWEARGILIWVPCPMDETHLKLPHIPQVLGYAELEDFLGIARAASGLATFFNSLHGGASANHLHFQSVYCERRMAVESAETIREGAYTLLRNYPASGVVFPLDAAPSVVWGLLESIQTAGYPFNLIALASGIFLFVRDPQHEVLDEFPGRAFGAINLAGLFITSDAEERKRVTDRRIAEAYELLTVGGEPLRRLIRECPSDSCGDS